MIHIFVASIPIFHILRLGSQQHFLLAPGQVLDPKHRCHPRSSWRCCAHCHRRPEPLPILARFDQFETCPDSVEDPYMFGICDVYIYVCIYIYIYLGLLGIQHFGALPISVLSEADLIPSHFPLPQADWTPFPSPSRGEPWHNTNMTCWVKWNCLHPGCGSWLRCQCLVFIYMYM